VAVGTGAGLGKEVEADAEAVIVTVDDHWAAFDLDSNRLLLEARSHSAAAEQVVVVAWICQTFVKTWSGTVLKAMEWFASSLSVSDLVGEQHRRWTRKLHPVGMRMHGHCYLVDSSGLAGCCNPPCSAKHSSASRF